MKYRITGLKKITLTVEGTSPNDAVCRFVGVTGGAEPTIVNGMDVLGKCGRCGVWLLAPDGEYYGDDHELICGQCYWALANPRGTEDFEDPDGDDDGRYDDDHSPYAGDYSEE